MDCDPLLVARARVLRDLQATGAADPGVVSQLEEAVAHRRWWVAQWPEGVVFVDGLVAQDVQDRLLEREGRWPTCPRHDREALVLEPELDPAPRWVCYAGCGAIAPLGGLQHQ
jgi:hypothetical protein